MTTMDDPAAQKAMDALRTGTLDLHREVEARSSMSKLIRGGLSEQAYAEVLRALYRFYMPLEATLRAAPDRLGLAPLWEEKAPLLAADLSALGSAPALCDDRFERLTTEADYLGALYVTEGATLGGMLIAARVEKALARTPGEVTRFFRCYGEGTRGRWKRFRAAVGARLARSEGVEEAVAAARYTFESFGAALSLDLWRHPA